MMAPVEMMICTRPASIIWQTTSPILAMLMAPEMVSTRVQSGSSAMAREDLEGLAQLAAAEGRLGHPLEQIGQPRGAADRAIPGAAGRLRGRRAELGS